MTKAIACQDVEFYVNNNKKAVSKGKIKLNESQITFISENKMKISVKFKHSMIVLSTGSGHLHICPSKDLTFTVLIGENALQWEKMINFYLMRHLSRATDPHPLTMFDYGHGACQSCAKVINSRLDQRSFQCEFCLDADAFCYECYGGVHSLLMRSAKSASHHHALYRFDAPPVKKIGEVNICSQCHAPCDAFDDENCWPSYHCLECLDYVECLQCFKAPKMRDVHEKLDLKHFTEFVVVENNYSEISMKTDPAIRYPANVSLITSGYWDLSNISTLPADNAYFEVQFLSFNPDAVVGIGIGNEIFESHALLGNQQNSFAYYNNGQIRRNFEACERAAVEFHPGDTVGCGILLDNYSDRKVYFTLNGKLLDQYVLVHAGMNCFPGVCFTKQSAVHFKTNFHGPFVFDVKSIPNYRNDTTNYFDTLPNEVIAMLFQYTAKFPLHVFAQLQLVCNSWKSFANVNILWRDAFMKRWPNQNPNLNLRNWKRFYQIRKEEIVSKGTGNAIENCGLIFQCPLLWQNLKPTATPGVNHCSACNKDVYAVKDKKTLQTYSQMGRCVAFNPAPLKIETPELNINYLGFMGRVAFPFKDHSDSDDDWDSWDD